MSPIAEPNDEKMWRLLPFVFDFSDISNTAAHPSEYGSFFWGCYFVLNLWKAEPFVLIFSPDCFIFSFITPFFYFWIYNKHIYTYTIQPSPMKNQFSQHGFLAILPVICIVNSIIHDLKYTIFFRKSLPCKLCLRNDFWSNYRRMQFSLISFRDSTNHLIQYVISTRSIYIIFKLLNVAYLFWCRSFYCRLQTCHQTYDPFPMPGLLQ